MAGLQASANKSQAVFGGQSTDGVSITHAGEPEGTSRLVTYPDIMIFIFSIQVFLKPKLSELLNWILSFKLQT